MYNKKLKKLLATLLATLMVFGCCGTAFAVDPVTTTGTGAPEGHVDKNIASMVLPTLTAANLNIKVDPEGLIQDSNQAAYEEGTTFPAAASDTHVYFLTGTKTYANSVTFYAANIGVKDVTLTVKAKAAEGASGTDIGLATAKDTLVNGENPLLYLELKVGDTTKILTSADQEVTATVAGTPGNYEVTHSAASGYAYTVKTPETDNKWKAAAVTLSGAVGSKPIASTTTCPGIVLTWSWAEADAGATANTDVVDVSKNSENAYVPAEVPSVDVTSVGPNNRVFNITKGTLQSITIVRPAGSAEPRYLWSVGTQYTVTGNRVEIAATPFGNAANANSKLELVFTEPSGTVTIDFSTT